MFPRNQNEEQRQQKAREMSLWSIFDCRFQSLNAAVARTDDGAVEKLGVTCSADVSTLRGLLPSSLPHFLSNSGFQTTSEARERERGAEGLRSQKREAWKRGRGGGKGEVKYWETDDQHQGERGEDCFPRSPH